MNVLGQAVENGIRAEAAYNLERFGLSQTFVEPFVLLEVLIDARMTAAGIDKGRLLRSISKSGKVNRDTLSDWAVWSVVLTTERYLGSEQEIIVANDNLGL
jgi:hypothetical protein